MRSFAVINQKGGCGKTTTSINLAAAFAGLGRKTLLVDMDPQGHCALGLAVPESQLDSSIADAMLADPRSAFDLQDLLWQISANLELAPSTTSLAAAEHQLAHEPDRDLRLSKLLKSVSDKYDLCVIDCPPSIGLLTFNALRAADEVIIPVETGYFALSGAVKQATTLSVLADRVGHAVCFHVLPTMYDVRMKMAREIVVELRRHFGDAVLDIPIQFNAKLKEAASFGQPISEYDPASRGSQDFERLARHLLAAQAKPNRIRVTDETVRRFASAGEAAPAALDPLLQPEAIAPAPVRTPRVKRDPVAAIPQRLPEPVAPAPMSRVAELVARAKALSERTAMMQQKLAADPEVIKVEREIGVEPAPVQDPRARQTLEEKLRMFYGVRPITDGALFVQPAAEARSICVAGDFNGWSPVATPMQQDRRLGVWQTSVPLKPGRYRYRLIIDGRWTCDAHNSRVETNPFGEMNNFVDVR